MIRTKEQLLTALVTAHTVSGHIRNKPSSPWEYSVYFPDGRKEVVHGTAIRAAERAGLIRCVLSNWRTAKYRVARSGKEA